MSDAERPSLLAVAVASIQGLGRLVKTDWDLETFEVLAENDGAEPTLGVVLSASRAIVLYQVWADYVPEPARTAVTEYVTRANTDLYTSAFEFDLGNGSLSVRSGVHVGDVDVARPTLAGLLRNALTEVESTAAEHAPGVAALLGGASVADALAKVQAG